MTPYDKRPSRFTKRMAEDMRIRNLAQSTVDSYTYHVDRFAHHFGKNPENLGPEEVREFQVWMIDVNKSSFSQFNQAVCALRFFYTHTHPRDWVVKMIPFGKRPKMLPTVLGQNEVQRLIECVLVPKHRAVLITLYAAGLRLAEATHLKLHHIDSERMQIKVVQGKGAKDRFVPLSPKLLFELRQYWKVVRPTDYLFPGKTDDVPLSSATIQRTCKMAAAQAHIAKPISPHSLRHSYATGLLEAGVDLLTISKLLGHSCFTTTMIYLHCRREHLGTAPSPIDWLPIKQCPRWVDPTLQAPLTDPKKRDKPNPDVPPSTAS